MADASTSAFSSKSLAVPRRRPSEDARDRSASASATSALSMSISALEGTAVADDSSASEDVGGALSLAFEDEYMYDDEFAFLSAPPVAMPSLSPSPSSAEAKANVIGGEDNDADDFDALLAESLAVLSPRGVGGVEGELDADDEETTPRNAADADRRDRAVMARLRASSSVTDEEVESWRSHWTPHDDEDEVLIHVTECSYCLDRTTINSRTSSPSSSSSSSPFHRLRAFVAAARHSRAKGTSEAAAAATATSLSSSSSSSRHLQAPVPAAAASASSARSNSVSSLTSSASSSPSGGGGGTGAGRSHTTHRKSTFGRRQLFHKRRARKGVMFVSTRALYFIEYQIGKSSKGRLQLDVDLDTIVTMTKGESNSVQSILFIAEHTPTPAASTTNPEHEDDTPTPTEAPPVSVKATFYFDGFPFRDESFAVIERCAQYAKRRERRHRRRDGAGSRRDRVHSDPVEQMVLTLGGAETEKEVAVGDGDHHAFYDSISSASKLHPDVGGFSNPESYGGAASSKSFEQLLDEECGSAFAALLRVYAESADSGFLPHSQVFPRRWTLEGAAGAPAPPRPGRLRDAVARWW